METQNFTSDAAHMQPAVITLEAFGAFFQRHWRKALKLGGGIGLCSLLLSLLFLPQSYSANISLSILQPTDMASGLLASATGLGSSPTAKYVGVMKSRRFAEAVEDRFHLQALYHLRERDDAIEMITDGLTVTDNPKDGLLYVNLTFRAPALLAAWEGAKREKVRTLTTDAVNLYADLLRDYMATTDVDRDSILLRGAADQVKQIRADYNASVAHLSELIRTRGQDMGEVLMSAALAAGADATGSGSSGGDASQSLSVPKGLQSLYMARAELEADIQTTETVLNNSNRLLNAQLANPTALPTEDPLLMTARAEVVSTYNEYQAAKLQFGPDNPRAVTVHDRLVLAERTLNQQLAVIREGHSTPQIEAQMKLVGLRTRYNTLIGQIDKVEKQAHIGRDLMTEFTTRRNEVLVRLEVLKAALSQSAILSMQSIAATKKLTVVDTAAVPRHANPGFGLQALFSLMLTAFCLTCWALRDLRREAAEKARLTLTQIVVQEVVQEADSKAA